ncbi:MAG: alpha/beta hydrolase, partial [Deltaproteobacteria bacterium]|nr:alpha/beta hydrolase [Deltaproteobacteria bacterium]
MSKSKEMKELPIPQFFSNGHIAARFLRPVRKHESLIVAVPGGPALPSRYLDEFMLGLSQHLSANVGVLDLPNHGGSIIPFDKLPLRYSSCVSYVSRTLRELAGLTDKLVIVGHHTGARMILDMIISQGCRTRAVVLIDTPGGTCTMNRWKANVLQLFSSGISQGEASTLASEIKWEGNEQIFDRAP